MSNVIHIELLNTVETYRTLQPFETVEQLNSNTAAIREQYADQMTPATYEVLDALHRYACKYPGVSYRSKAKIAEELGLSQRTVIRACQALEAFGVIKQYATKRAGGDKRQSTNAIVFIAIVDEHKPEVMPECQPVDAPLNTQNNKPLLHNTFQPEPSLYNRFKALLTNSTGDATPASRLYGIYRAQSIKLLRYEIHADQGELFEDLAIQALRITTQATKRKKIRSLTGYFDGVLRELIDKALFSDAFMNYDVEPDWSAFVTH